MSRNKDIDFRLFARAAGEVVHYEKGDVIFKEHDRPNYMYIILSGSVEIISHDKLVEIIHEGSALGFVSVLDGRPRATTARAREACELAVMDRRQFRYMVDEVPNFGWYVMHELTHSAKAERGAGLELHPAAPPEHFIKSQ